MTQFLPDFDDVCAAEARVRLAAIETPVLTHPILDERAGARVLIKAENLQTTGSFKIRGASNRLMQIPEQDRPRGVVAFSSGNHAQGIARAAKLLDMPALIVMPEDAPGAKIEGVRADGAEIRFCDRDNENREQIAADIAAQRGAVLVPSYDDRHIIAGQGTAGLEFARQAEAMDAPLDHLISGVGGGGLISGLALAFEGLSPQTKIWCVEPEGHDDWRQSLEAGKRHRNVPGTRSTCDAILTPTPGELTWAVSGKRLAGGFAVTDEEVRAAMRFAFRHLKLVIEPGGAVSLALALRGLPEEMRGTSVGIMITGGNVDAAMFAELLD
ncbi:MAG: threonine/serine dehydratase [Hyphomonadaceae bacterium]